ncbi:MAG: hypothetical protein ACOC78_00240, partial [Actinomycetota bacterium]
RLANERGADLVLGLRPSQEESFHFYYFGTQSYASPRGRRLAEILHLEISAMLEVAPPQPEIKSYPLLRETRMPCVIVESPQDFDHASGLALRLARAVAGYFNPPGQDGAPA